ncbi:hypothetical protein [Oceanicola granulosus]|uniref:hypothetical protein n=1 Tax=Oceanicola granulosus TaxID=252302 RepID=UPI0012EA3C0A|nr:hypothetical protein [Oceanicola granulosus]
MWEALPPLLAADGKPRGLLVLINNADAALRQSFLEVLDASVVVQRTFSRVRVESAGLSGDSDLYIRGQMSSMGTQGNVAGPNNLFFKAIELAKDDGGFAFQCELDCFPLVSGWLTKLDECVSSFPQSWVIGSNYTGYRPIHPSVMFHINGNALYQVGDPQFQAFARQIWRGRILKIVNTRPNIAYDCWWQMELASAEPSRNSGWFNWVAFSHRFTALPLILNLLHRNDFREDLEIAKQIELLSGRRNIFLHAHFLRPVIQNYLRDENKMREDLLTVLAREVPDHAGSLSDERK